MYYYKWYLIFLFAVFGFHQIADCFNVITFLKNWSMRGSSSFPMPKGFLNVHKLLKREGYGYESYYVTTEDNYILKLTRVMPKNGGYSKKRPPVLMIHGITGTSESWVLRGQNQDLAPVLTEQGFDVWLGDIRGNHYSKNHKYLSPKNPDFWEFSFHESGIYDMPAFVDFILMKTGASRLGFVGHSMGTTLFLAFASHRPEYNRKLWGSALLAPVGYKFPIEDITNSGLRLLLAQFNFIFASFRSGGIHEVLPRTARMTYSVQKYCSHPPTQEYCLDIVGQFFGENRANLNKKRIGECMSHIPAGTSGRTLHHLGQVYNYGFNLYDYGPKMNMLKYNSTVPPAYPLHKITSPILILYGENDPLTSPKGARYLANSIPGVKTSRRVNDPKFTHIDFVLGLNTNMTIDQDVINFFHKYSMF